MVTRLFPLASLLILAGMELSASVQAPATAKPASLPTGAIRQLGEVRFPNVGHVMGLAFSPDGKQLVAGSWDSAVRVWEVATGKQLREITGHEGTVKNLAFTPDGTCLITQGRDRTIRVWDAATGKPLRQLEMPGPVGRSILSPDGKFLWANSGKDMLVWDVETGRELHRYGGETRVGERTVGFTPDSKEILSAAVWNGAGALVFRDALTGKKLRELETPAALELRFGQSYALGGRKILLSGWEGLHLLDLDTGRSRKVAGAGAEPNVLMPVFSPTFKAFAATDSQGVIHLWETATLLRRCSFAGHEPGTIPLAFSLDGKTLASGSTDSSVLLWDLIGNQTGRVPTAQLLAKDFEAAWSDLASNDAAKAYQAMGRLIAQPAAAVAFLKEQVPAASPAIEPAVLAQHIKDLASAKFQVREKATMELGNLGELAEPALRQALTGNSTLEVRQRVEKLLRRIEEAEFKLPPERLRLLRVVETVETIQSAEAVQLLKTWAAGAAGALLTRQAHQAMHNPKVR